MKYIHNTLYAKRYTLCAILIALFCLILPPTAQAATYYCDASQTGTNHAGTDVDPYGEADLSSKVLDVQWQPGDTIYCKGSFGNMSLPAQVYGSAGGGYVTWAAWPGFTPDANHISMPLNTANVYLIIDGWHLDKGWTDREPGNTVDLDDTSYIQIKNCTIYTARVLSITTGDNWPYNVGIDGVRDAGISDHEGSSDYITVEGCTFTNCDTGIYIMGSNWTITGNTFTRLSSTGILVSNTSIDIGIADNLFSDINDYYGPFGWPGVATGDIDSYIYTTFTNDTSGHTGIFPGFGSVTGAFRLVADDNTKRPVRGETIGSKWISDANPNVYWTITGAGDSAHCDGIEAYGGSQGHEIIIERNSFGNWFAGSGGSIRGQHLKMQHMTGAYHIADRGWFIFRNNICSDTDTGQAALILTSGMTGEDNSCVIKHNISIHKGGNAGIRSNYTGAHIYNNIFSKAVSDGYAVDAGYNIWLVSQATLTDNFEGLHDQYSVATASLFADYAASDFNTISGSPAINAGDANNTSTSDFTAVSNVRVDNAPPDIGAYEYISSTPPPSILYGDVSGEGEISAYDAALTAQAAIDLITLSPEQITAADVNGDTEVTAYDAALIAQKAVGLIEKFPAEE